MASAYEERREALKEINQIVHKSRKKFRDVQNSLAKATALLGQAPPDAPSFQRLAASALALNTIVQGAQVLQECLNEIDLVESNAGYNEIFTDIDDDAKARPEDPIAALLGYERQAILTSGSELRQAIVTAQSLVAAVNPVSSATLGAKINEINLELKTAVDSMVAAIDEYVPKQPGTVRVE